jgi:LuxR family transcriptional regulator, maltose regulon positive regulatory protein
MVICEEGRERRGIMPREARYALIWSVERGVYELYERGNGKEPVLRGEDGEWYVWLAAHSSFAFQGQDGRLNLLKEARKSGGQGYWYAYRSQGGRTVKRYVGNTDKLTMERLEGTARAFSYVVERIERGKGEGKAKKVIMGRDGMKGREGKEHVDRSVQGKDLGGRGKVIEVIEQIIGMNEQGLEERGQIIDRQKQDLGGDKRILDGYENVAMSSRQGVLLMPKLQLPRLYRALVVRERLLELLDKGLEQRLMLLSAPAGAGKTTLVRQWIAERSGEEGFPPVAWVSLDAGDNDPVRFWRYVMMACQSFQPDLAQEAAALLQVVPQPPFEMSYAETMGTVLTAFLNGLAQCPRGGILVLEDYHVITTPQIHETMTFFLDHLPERLHIVMITRSDPPFALARLRARNELCEVRGGELSFSQEETAAFLRQAIDIPVTPGMVRRLNVQLEGWAAGLRMVIHRLQGQRTAGEIEHFLTTFGRNYSSIQEYFVSEVLSTQVEELQRFLLQTSVLSRLTSSLCEAVTGRRDSGQILAELERANLFLESLDGGGEWYRYHALFAEAMQQEARRRLGEEMLRRLSSRARQWYEERGLHVEAVEAALHAQEYAGAAVLIEHVIEVQQSLDETNEYHTLHRWLEQMPEKVLKRHPVLCLGYAMALLFVVATLYPNRFMLGQLEKFLGVAEQKFGEEQNEAKLGEVFAFRSLVAWVAWVVWRQQDGKQAIHYARQALACLPERERVWRGLSLTIVGKAELLQSGEVATARKTLMEAYALCEAVGNQYFGRATTTMLARVFFEQGELQRAAEYHQKELSQDREREHSDDICHALLGLAEVAYERNELETAQEQAQEALAIGQYFGYELHEVHASLMLAQVQQAQGESTAARQRLAALLARMSGRNVHNEQFYREVQNMQIQLALASGDLAAVQRWVNEREQHEEHAEMGSAFAYEQEELLIARWWLAQGKVEEALRLLERLVEGAREAGRIYRALEMQVVMAQVYAMDKRVAEARQRLLEVLEQTQAEGYLRLFLDEGAMMAGLLRSLVPHVREKSLLAYLQSILHAFPTEQKAIAMSGVGEVMEPLSAQELRVLRQLALGRSNGEIAREMVVSINTVRTQVQSIYRKLDVHNRVAAGEVARRLEMV